MAQLTIEVSDVIAGLQGLVKTLEMNTYARTKRRVVTKMAKNIEHGDYVEFGDFGWGQVNAWVAQGDEIMIGAPQKPGLTFKATDRVRIQREVPVEG